MFLPLVVRSNKISCGGGLGGVKPYKCLINILITGYILLALNPYLLTFPSKNSKMMVVFRE